MGVNPNSGEVLQRLLERYDRNQRAVPVNFRRLVSWIPLGERATHYLHPYPAKLLPQIPAFLLSNSILSEPGNTVLDPFCGSGTVLLESILHGRNALGADANPLARLITQVKVAQYSPKKLEGHLEEIVRRASFRKRRSPPVVVNIDYWFYPHVIDQLCQLREAIEGIQERAVSSFYQVCLSATVRRVSLADPRISVPVRLRADQYPRNHPLWDQTNNRLRSLRRQNVVAEFVQVAEANIERVRALAGLRGSNATAAVIAHDARTLGNFKKPVDLILTSPPYAGAQKYIRSSSLSLGWLELMGCGLKDLEDKSIGREHHRHASLASIPATGLLAADKRISKIAKQNPLRAVIVAKYLIEMRDALREGIRVLKPGGHMVIVAGNNRVCGREFQTQSYLQQMMEELRMKTRLRVVDAIRSRGLMTRRNKTADVIAREWVLVFQKPR